MRIVFGPRSNEITAGEIMLLTRIVAVLSPIAVTEIHEILPATFAV